MRLAPWLITAAVALAAAPAAAAAPPPNDNFANATPLGDAPLEFGGTLAGATLEPGEQREAAPTVWFAFRPTTSRRVALDPLPAEAESPWVKVFTGTTLADLRAVSELNGAGDRVVIDAVAGRTYWLSVSPGGDGQQFRLRLRPAVPPANDAFAAAQRVAVPGVYPGQVADATLELGEPDHAGGRGLGSLWYRFRAKRAGRLTIDVEDAECAARLVVYRGSSLSRLRRVGSASGGPVRFRAQRGRSYRVMVGCNNDGDGEFALRISDGGITGKGVAMTVDPDQTLQSLRDRGLSLRISTRRKVHLRISLRVSAATARLLGLDSRVLGRTRGVLGYNRSIAAVVQLTPAARRALRDEDELAATVRLELANATVRDRTLDSSVRLAD